ncbi:MAG: response regulator [Candidatus Eremiobacterota bacterium]
MDEPIRILVVDDDPLTLDALSDLLSRAGSVRASALPSDALAYLEQHPVDVVVSDQVMPEMTGDRFLSLVRQRWPDTERILVTGFCDLASVVRAVNQGGICHSFCKPWDNAEVLQAVTEAGGRARRRRVSAP